MKNVNRVTLLGNLTREPEEKGNGNGNVTLVSFGIATSREWTTKTGEKKSSTELHEIVVWGKLAEICKKFLYKGRTIYIEGRIQSRKWENEEGEKRHRTEIVAEDVIILGKKKEDFNKDNSFSIDDDLNA